MDLVSIEPIFNLYNREWPILTNHPQLPGAKFVEGGHAHESIVNQGCIIAGGSVVSSVLSPNVTVRPAARVEGCVLMNNVEVGRDAYVRNAILDKNVVIPDGARIGVDPTSDRAAGYTVSENGIVVVGKAHHRPSRINA